MTSPRDAVTFANARVWTADPARPHARSIVVRGGSIAAIDGAPEGEVVDLGGRWVGPAFIDSHLHLTLGAATLAQCDLSGCGARAEFERRVGAHARGLDAAGDPAAWFVGFGWNEADWRGDAPDRSWLAAAGDRPAVAWRMDQHACVVNDAALARLDLSPIDGGEIEPARGIFREQAAWKRVIPAVPEPSVAAKRANLAKACAHLHALGLAAVGSMEYLRDIEAVFLPGRDSLSLRVHATVLDRDWPLDAPPKLPRDAHPFFAIVGMKSFADGTLGSRTAWMLEPYADAPATCGLAMEHALRGELAAWMRAVQALGLSPSVHAIGDRAARELLDAFDACADAPAPRFEHAQTLHPCEIPRLAGRFASMQPLHKADDARLAMARLGPSRIARFFAFRALLAHGARLAFGSDWPIVSPDPLLGVKAAVTSLDLDGRPFATEHSIPVHDALVAYTRTGAEMLGLPGGMLRAGRAADLVVLDRSPFECDWTRELPGVDATIISGRPVHSRLPMLRP
ncbi:MAG: amidohydrolase [Planctomycetota bacterium]